MNCNEAFSNNDPFSTSFFSANLFDDDRLDHIRNKSLKHFTVSGDKRPMLQQDVSMFGSTFGSLSLLSMFVERGRLSGHPYQPDVNHRFINFETFYNQNINEEGVIQPPLVESLVTPTPKTDFSNNDKIGLHFYEIEEGTSTEYSRQLLSGNTYSVNFPENENFSGSGSIKNRMASKVTNAGFKRVLKLFGYKWMQKQKPKKTNNKKKNQAQEVPDEEPVTLEVLLEFANLMNVPMTSNEDICNMVKQFNLENIFQVDEALTAEENRRHFFLLVNSLAPLRLCVFDGKHRFFLLLLWVIGIYDARQQIRWGFSPYSTFLSHSSFVGIPRESIVYEKMACFTEQTVFISEPEEQNLTISEGYAVLSLFGSHKTSAAGLHVQETTLSLLQEFVSYMDQRDEYEHITKLDYDHFWQVKNDPVLTNGQKIMEILLTWAAVKGKKDAIQGGATSWGIVEDKLKTKLESYEYPLGTTAHPRITGYPTTMQPFVVFVKYFLQGPGQFEVLKTFLQQQDPTWRQYPISLSYLSFYKTPQFLVRGVLQRVNKVAVHINNMLMLERKMLQNLRAAKNNEVFAAGLADPFGRFENWKDAIEADSTEEKNRVAFQFFRPADGEYLSATQMQMTQMKVANQKFRFAIHQSITCDAVKTISDYGWSPAYTKTGQTNRLLHLYLW